MTRVLVVYCNPRHSVLFCDGVSDHRQIFNTPRCKDSCAVVTFYSAVDNVSCDINISNMIIG